MTYSGGAEARPDAPEILPSLETLVARDSDRLLKI